MLPICSFHTIGSFSPRSISIDNAFAQQIVHRKINERTTHVRALIIFILSIELH